jgi:hypothetical protein
MKKTHIIFLGSGSGEALITDRAMIEKKMKDYRSRAAQIRTRMLANNLPDVPGYSGFGQATLNDLNSKQEQNLIHSRSLVNSERLKTTSDLVDSLSVVCDHAQQFNQEYAITSRLATASSNVGQVAISAVQTAQSVEEEYHVSERVVESVRTVAATAQKVEEDYHVTQRLICATREAVRLAAEYEERYRIQQRMQVFLQGSWESVKALSTQAVEYNQQYQLSQRAGAAVMNGVSSAIELSKDATWTQWSYFASSETPDPPALPPNAQV